MAEAKSLLASAGFANGLDLEFLYPGKAYGDQYVQEVGLMPAQLKNFASNFGAKGWPLEASWLA